jgi:hypothetical protein
MTEVFSPMPKDSFPFYKKPLRGETQVDLSEAPSARFARLKKSFSSGAVLRLERRGRGDVKVPLPGVALAAFEKGEYTELTKLLREHMGKDDRAEFRVDWFSPSSMQVEGGGRELVLRGSMVICFGRPG